MIMGDINRSARKKLAEGSKENPRRKKSKSIDYLFENCGDLLAFFFPGFFLSTTLESLVRSPIGLRIALNDGSYSTSAFVIPCFNASA